jgi:ABC-type oligopeptide transport system ATPase subunit
MTANSAANSAASGAADAVGSTAAAPLLSLVDVTKHYRPGGLLARSAAPVQAVSGVSLEIAAGSTLGIVGESGCGKSTLGRMVVGLEKPTEGEVRLRGAALGRSAGRPATTCR